MTVKKTYSSAPVEEPTAPPAPTPVCEVVEQPDQSVIITLRVEAHIARRHKLRAGIMNIDRYYWENILHRALVDSVY